MTWIYGAKPEHSEQVLIMEEFYGEKLYSVACWDGEKWTDDLKNIYEPKCWTEIYE